MAVVCVVGALAEGKRLTPVNCPLPAYHLPITCPSLAYHLPSLAWLPRLQGLQVSCSVGLQHQCSVHKGSLVAGSDMYIYMSEWTDVLAAAIMCVLSNMSQTQPPSCLSVRRLV